MQIEIFGYFIIPLGIVLLFFDKKWLLYMTAIFAGFIKIIPRSSTRLHAASMPGNRGVLFHIPSSAYSFSLFAEQQQ